MKDFYLFQIQEFSQYIKVSFNISIRDQKKSFFDFTQKSLKSLIEEITKRSKKITNEEFFYELKSFIENNGIFNNEIITVAVINQYDNDCLGFFSIEHEKAFS